LGVCLWAEESRPRRRVTDRGAVLHRIYLRPQRMADELTDRVLYRSVVVPALGRQDPPFLISVSCNIKHAAKAFATSHAQKPQRGRGIYDNMKTAVETIFVGKQRLYNRRFLQMCSHYLVDPVACTPASGWEKGQVENQVGLVRERFFTPRLRSRPAGHILTPAALTLRHAPVADCARYDNLRRTI
jgi:hypothetical protein